MQKFIPTTRVRRMQENSRSIEIIQTSDLKKKTQKNHEIHPMDK